MLASKFDYDAPERSVINLRKPTSKLPPGDLA